MGKRGKPVDGQAKADQFDKSHADAQARVAAKGGKPAALPPKPTKSGNIGTISKDGKKVT